MKLGKIVSCKASISKIGSAVLNFSHRLSACVVSLSLRTTCSSNSICSDVIYDSLKHTNVQKQFNARAATVSSPQDGPRGLEPRPSSPEIMFRRSRTIPAPGKSTAG